MANIINGTDTGSGGLITTGDSSDELQLQTAETARVTLTNTAVVVNEGGNDVDFRVEGDTDANLLFVDAGNDRVGIGTNAPSTKLTVSGTGAVSSRTIATDATGDASFFVQNNNSQIAGPLVYGSTKSAYGALGSNETAFYSNASTTLMADGGSAIIKFATGGNTERMRITSAGAVEIANGNLKFTTNGTGIDFSASAGGGATSSLLDDYEEGTWTPTVTTGTISTSYGAYIKIGNQVTVRGSIGDFSTIASSNTVTINNLPFTANNQAGQGAAGACFANYNTNGPNASYVSSNTTDLNFFNTKNTNANYAAIKHNDFYVTGGIIYFEASYLV